MLIVIDNFEHVADAALLLTDLLMANPDLTIMVTSRSVLSVYGEHVYPVPPMSVPNLPDEPVSGTRAHAITACVGCGSVVREAGGGSSQ